MSKAIELLLECKVKLGVKTDYKLAQALKIERMRISDYMSGKRTPDNYACMRIAMILQRNPTEILALIESETEKNEVKRAFWLDFLGHAKQAANIGMLLVIFTAAMSAGNSQGQRGFSSNRLYFA